MPNGEQSAIGCPAGKPVAQALQNKGDDQQDDHAYVHNIGMVLILSVVNGKGANAAGTHRTGHGRQADQTDGGHGGDADQIRHRFMEVDAKDQPQRAAAHAARCLDLALIHAGQGNLHLSGVKGYRIVSINR